MLVEIQTFLYNYSHDTWKLSETQQPNTHPERHKTFLQHSSLLRSFTFQLPEANRSPKILSGKFQNKQILRFKLCTTE